MIKVVVVGNGMVGHRFVERLTRQSSAPAIEVTVFGEEPRPAYDRVQLTKYFEKRAPELLQLAGKEWYAERGISLQTGQRVTEIDRAAKMLRTASGSEVFYDKLVLATGSAPFVPPTPGMDKKGVFVYRTIEDLEQIIAYSKKCKTAVVIGGGLLGLEAAKAVKDLGLQTTVVEFSSRLMPRQLDERGATLLRREIERQGVRVLLNHSTEAVLGNGSVTALQFKDRGVFFADMVIVSAGIRPRDELARSCGLELGARGGIAVSDTLATSDPDVYAIGEVASHRGTVYGLVAPGYQMADVLAEHLLGGDSTFEGGDMSTKLKLLGVDVASFGDPFAEGENINAVEKFDPIDGQYMKIVLNGSGRTVLGGMLVGDSSAYSLLAHYARTGEPLPKSAGGMFFSGAGAAEAAEMPDSAQVCSCNNVTHGQICSAIRDGSLHEIGAVQACTRAGTGCGGCTPTVKDILTQELKRAGVPVKKTICAHFAMSRQELFHAVKVRKLKAFDDVIDALGTGMGCEVCKPAVASIVASLWSEHIVEHAQVQDTNDRFLANIQRGGSYSIVPRVPGGEITPEKLIVLGEVAKKYSLYCKITGGQRIDLLGARVDQLPGIWEELIEAGFESGHAYGKAVRTVKSCVGSTWCRYGVQDSTSFAIRIEERYKGIRAPHKLKFAVSGCVRECAEARCKDVGLIATEKGWNLYVCGNGGAKPRHADLLVPDIDADTAIKLIDRFLMYYIHTADPLTRTSVWLEGLDGGLEQLRKVIIEDELNISETLEADMAQLVGNYACEWKGVVEDPLKRAKFAHFADKSTPDPAQTFVPERGQRRPGDWPIAPAPAARTETAAKNWWHAGRLYDFPKDAGVAVDYDGVQIAVFNFARQGRWYAAQNMCPHKRDMVLARGLLGDKDGIAKVACPMHKKQFFLETGACVSGDELSIQTFQVKLEGGGVYVLLPPASSLADTNDPAKCVDAACV